MAIGQNRAKVPCLIFVLVYQGFERNKAIRQDSVMVFSDQNLTKALYLYSWS